MQKYHGMPVEYLGDGLFALYDYTGIWLHANHHANPTDKVYLESSVLKALNNFSEKMKDIKTGKIKEEILCPKCGCKTQLIKDRERECLCCKNYFGLGKQKFILEINN